MYIAKTKNRLYAANFWESTHCLYFGENQRVRKTYLYIQV